MKIFCSGIGGIGLSAYAALQHASGHTVSGSDRSLSAITADLEQQGLAITDCQDGSGIHPDTDLLVYSEAIPEDSPERVKARALGIRSLSYFQALGELTAQHRLIAVCGSHGKSSTTAMAATVLTGAGRDPSVVVGTKVPQLQGRNWRAGHTDLFLVEACEYRGSFLHLHPSIIVLTNVDWDHVDAYPTPESYAAAFAAFLDRLPANGVVVVHGGDPVCRQLAEASGKTIVDADTLPLPKLSIPGAHMQENARLALALALHCGVSEHDALQHLRAFRGTWRRVELLGMAPGGVLVVDDYAHHPREISATLGAVRERFPQRRLVAVFQPHMHDRTIALWREFVLAFRGCDVLLLTDVYEARREQTTEKADLRGLSRDIGGGTGIACLYAGTLEQTEAELRKVLMPGDLLLCMGAGSVTELAHRMVQSRDVSH